MFEYHFFKIETVAKRRQSETCMGPKNYIMKCYVFTYHDIVPSMLQVMDDVQVDNVYMGECFRILYSVPR